VFQRTFSTNIGRKKCATREAFSLNATLRLIIKIIY